MYHEQLHPHTPVSKYMALCEGGLWDSEYAKQEIEAKKYYNYGEYDEKSVMLYGSYGTEKGQNSCPSVRDAETVAKIFNSDNGGGELIKLEMHNCNGPRVTAANKKGKKGRINSLYNKQEWGKSDDKTRMNALVDVPRKEKEMRSDRISGGNRGRSGSFS